MRGRFREALIIHTQAPYRFGMQNLLIFKKPLFKTFLLDFQPEETDFQALKSLTITF